MANFKSCRSNLKVSMRTLSILIPAHNEEVTIQTFVSALSVSLESFLEKRVLDDYEIIILDDGSTDKTPEILGRIELSRARILYSLSASGIHGAFMRLYAEARMHWILLVPGDAQWPASEIEKLIRFHFMLDEPVPTSTIRREKYGYSWARLWVSSAFGYFANIFLNLDKLPDPGSIKVMPSETIRLDYICNSVLIEIERMMSSKLIFGTLREFQIETVPRVYGSSSAMSIKTLKPILVDCCKLILFYKVLGKQLIIRDKKVNL